MLTVWRRALTEELPFQAKCCWCGGALVYRAQAERSSEWVPEGLYWCETAACRLRQREYAYARNVVTKDGRKKTERVEYLFVPLPKQVEFLGRMAPYKLYGGAAGPGKSYAMRWALYRLARVIPNFRALILRENFGELEQTHYADMEVEQELVGARFVKGSNLMIWDDNKSRIIGGHLDDQRAVRRYLSTNYDVIACDEGSQYPPMPLLELSTRARTTKAAAKPYVGDGQFWVATNPGGPAAAMLKDFFITHTPDFEVHPKLQAKYRSEDWVYIKALLEDNPYSAASYETKLAVLQSWRYEQLRNADWDVSEGAFFEGFSARTHGRALNLPRPLQGVVEAVDWGFTSPGCVGWFVPLADNHWHCVAEWKFRKLVAEDVARGILEMRRELGIGSITYTVVDPSMRNKTGHGQGESFIETFTRCGVPCRLGHSDREMGWPRLAAAFKLAPDGVPWLTFEPGECKYLLRSIPGLLADKTNPEDVDTKMDDHGADMARMFVMSRPPSWKDAPSAAIDYPEGSVGWWDKHYFKAEPESAGVLA